MERAERKCLATQEKCSLAGAFFYNFWLLKRPTRTSYFFLSLCDVVFLVAGAPVFFPFTHGPRGFALSWSTINAFSAASLGVRTKRLIECAMPLLHSLVSVLVLASCLLAPTLSGPAVTHPLAGAMRAILITAVNIRAIVQKNNSNPLHLVSLVGIFCWCFLRNPPSATSSPFVAVPIASTQRKPSMYLLFVKAGAAEIDDHSKW